MAGQERLRDSPLKTIIIALLGVAWWLAVSPSWADDHGESATGCETATIAAPAAWTVGNDSAETNRNWGSLDGPPSLDLDHYPPPDEIATITASPPTASQSTDSDEERDPDVCASFILIGLGGGVLIGIRWRMFRKAQTDGISAK